MKKAIFGRHGIKGKDGNLTSETISTCYDKGQEFLRGAIERLSPNDAYIRYSSIPRTEYTAKAVMSGALGITPKPQTQEDLDKPSLLTKIDKRVAKALDVNDLKVDAPLEKQIGLEAYSNLLAKYPDMKELEGIEMTSWNEMRESARKYLPTILNKLKNKTFGVNTSHALITDSVVLALINTGRKNPITNPNDIGGWFNMEEMAVLDLRNSRGLLNLRGQDYLVDLSKL